MDEVISCEWRIYINGTELDNARYECITDMEFEEICDGSDTCTIKLQDPAYAFIEDNIFIEEAKIKVVVNVKGAKDGYFEFSGYISAIDIDFPEEGYPSMSIFCLDKSHLMNRKKKDRTWDNVTSADVVKKIAQEYGFKCVVESGYSFKKQDNIAQSDQTDIEFIENLASEETDLFMCKLVGDTVYYIKKGLLANPVSTLAYREVPYSVISFSPQINKETRQEEIEKSDIAVDTKQPETSTATSENTVRETQGSSVKTSTVVSGESGESAVTYNAEERTWTSTAEAKTANSAMTDFVNNIDWEEYEG